LRDSQHPLLSPVRLPVSPPGQGRQVYDSLSFTISGPQFSRFLGPGPAGFTTEGLCGRGSSTRLPESETAPQQSWNRYMPVGNLDESGYP